MKKKTTKVARSSAPLLTYDNLLRKAMTAKCRTAWPSSTVLSCERSSIHMETMHSTLQTAPALNDLVVLEDVFPMDVEVAPEEQTVYFHIDLLEIGQKHTINMRPGYGGRCVAA